MGIVASMLAGVPGPMEDYWYGPIGGASIAGPKINAETAMKISVVWRAIAIIAGSIAKLPLKVIEQLSDGSKQPARDHPLYRILHDHPNPRQNSFQWREQMQTHLLLRGNMFNRYLPPQPGVAYPFSGLAPIMPDLVRIKQLPNGDVVYLVRDPITGVENPETSDDIWHVIGLSMDGVRGLSVIDYARESMGLATATEASGARLFGNGINPSVVLTHKGKPLSEDAANRLGREFAQAHAGVGNAQGVVVLEEDTTMQQLSLTSEQAQFLGTREFQIRDVARWFGIYPHLLGETQRQTSWGTGLEQMTTGFVIFTLMDWLVRWESAINNDLLIGNSDGRFFAQFTVDGLLRGDMRTRHETYRGGLAAGYYSANDVRGFENLNPIPGGDQYNRPATVAPRQLPIRQTALVTRPEQVALMVADAAGRVIRKETVAMTRIAHRCGSDAAAWEVAVSEFYREHPAYVSELLHVSDEAASVYCLQQRDALLDGGPDVDVMATWPTERRQHLIDLCMEES